MPGITTIRDDIAGPYEMSADRREDIDGAVAILNVGGRPENEDQEAAVISENIAPAPVDFLPALQPLTCVPEIMPMVG